MSQIFSSRTINLQLMSAFVFCSYIAVTLRQTKFLATLGVTLFILVHPP